MLAASYTGHLPVVQYLVEEKGADIKERDNIGNFFYVAVYICILKEPCKKYTTLITERMPRVDPIPKI